MGFGEVQMKLVNLALVTVAAAVMSGSASAATLWYNGDFDGVNGGNISGMAGFDSRIYDDFQVNGSGWNVDGAFMQIVSSIAPANLTTWSWEIRQGMSTGNGGSVVASGTSSLLVTATGGSAFGRPEYKVSVSGLNVNLSAGHYWLGGKIGGTDTSNDIYLETTGGANFVGFQGNNDNSFWDSTSFGFAYNNASDGLGSAPADFVMGVTGTEVVPEPASMCALGFGIAGIIAKRRKKSA